MIFIILNSMIFTNELIFYVNFSPYDHRLHSLVAS